MGTKKPLKLTRLQREILQTLSNGGMITIDAMNLASLSGRPIQPQTRYFLTENRLVTRLDKSKSAEAKGNGFVISEKGKRVVKGIR